MKKNSPTSFKKHDQKTRSNYICKKFERVTKQAKEQRVDGINRKVTDRMENSPTARAGNTIEEITSNEERNERETFEKFKRRRGIK